MPVPWHPFSETRSDSRAKYWNIATDRSRFQAWRCAISGPDHHGRGAGRQAKGTS